MVANGGPTHFDAKLWGDVTTGGRLLSLPSIAACPRSPLPLYTIVAAVMLHAVSAGCLLFTVCGALDSRSWWPGGGRWLDRVACQLWCLV